MNAPRPVNVQRHDQRPRRGMRRQSHRRRAIARRLDLDAARDRLAWPREARGHERWEARAPGPVGPFPPLETR